MGLRVLQIGADARLVGPAQNGYRKFGVPPGGPFDRESWTWAVSLSGRSDEALELGPFGGVFLAETDLTVSIVGAERDIRVNGRPCAQGRIALSAGDRFEVGSVSMGARSYLAWAGRPGSKVGLEQRVVARGDVLEAGPGAPPARLAKLPNSLSNERIRCVDGPQSHLFKGEAFFDIGWSVSSEADRMGIRLAGPVLKPSTPWGERPSEPQTPGCIQVTVGGRPIILGPDGPTIGGYPKIAVVIDADMDKVGQLRAGSVVTFCRIEIAEARQLRLTYREKLSTALIGPTKI